VPVIVTTFRERERVPGNYISFTLTLTQRNLRNGASLTFYMDYKKGKTKTITRKYIYTHSPKGLLGTPN